VVNVALPGFMRQFGIGLDSAEWIALGYRIVTAITLLPAGRIADMIGRKRVFLFGVIVFTLGSALCAIAPNISLLVVFRILQGIGATAMLATYAAIIVAVFPSTERGKALGIVGTVIALGTAISPTLGGILVQLFGPSSVFTVNIPLGIIGLIGAGYVLREERVSNPRKPGDRFDLAGAVLAGLAVLLLLLALENEIGGYEVGPIRLPLIVVGAGLLGAFVLYELRTRQPMLDVRLFTILPFTIAGIIMFVVSAALGVNTIVLPLFLQLGLDESPIAAGLELLPLSVMLAITGPISGTLSDKIGARWLTFAGLVVVMLSLLMMSMMSANATFVQVGFPLALLGLGAGLYQAPNNSVAFGAVPKEKLGVVGGVRSTLLAVGLAFGTALGESILAAGLAPLGGIEALSTADPALRSQLLGALVSSQALAFRIAAGIVFVGVVLAFFRSGSLGGEPAARAEQPRPAAAE
jgi:EmrB/QacA subfamily drug resistance transporter